MSEKPRSLVIIGAGGCGRDLPDAIDAVNVIQPTYDVLGFIVDPRYGKPGTIINEKPIPGGFDWFEKRPDATAICGVDVSEHCRTLVARAVALGVSFCTVIHPDAVLTRWITIGEGYIITTGCVLTNQITIGNHVHINLGSTIAHDARLGSSVTLAPGVHVSGNVTMDEGCYLGTGVNIIENTTIGAWSIVGTGSTIVEDVPPNTTVVSVPGKVIETREDGWHLK
jgi:sugar O-acyltransferase (sialic acid O-acetyltransferase NeuD family)